jgi:hypothetical protein
MTPVAKQKSSSRRAALKDEDLQKKSHCDEAQARNEHLKVSARVEDSHLQLLAIYGGIEVVNKAIAKGNQEISSIETKSVMPRDRYSPSASTAKFSVEPGTKPTVKHKINNAFCIHATPIHEKKGPSILRKGRRIRSQQHSAVTTMTRLTVALVHTLRLVLMTIVLTCFLSMSKMSLLNC